MAEQESVKVLIVDDHVLFSQALQGLLSSEPDFEVVGRASQVQEAIECVVRLKPDLVLLDLGLADGSGFDVLKEIVSRRLPTIPVILTGHDFQRYMFEAIRMGAKGYIQKETTYPSLIAALRGVRQGEAAVTRSMASLLVEEVQRLGSYVEVEPGALDTLTTRERQVLALLASGADTLEIAERLVISKHTVKVHIHNLLDKLNLKNRAQAVRFAQRYGFDKPAASQALETAGQYVVPPIGDGAH
jgi:DNA-binding NarL/FixJ family response regulator